MKFSSIRHRLSWPFSFAFAWLFVKFIQVLPRWALTLLARLLGRLFYLAPGQRRVPLANLSVVFPEWNKAAKKLTARRAMQSTVLGLFEFFWVQKRPSLIPKLVAFPEESRRLLEDAKGAATGLIILTLHIGNWELVNLGLNALDFPLRPVARRQPNPWVNALVETGRALTGARAIREKGAAREILTALRAGDTVAMLVDQNTTPHKGGVFTEFFGLPVPISRAPAAFARRTDTAIVLVFCIRRQDGTFSLEARSLAKPAAECADETELCRQINKATEGIIRDYPDQYLWWYRRFRYIPPDWPGDHNRYPYYSKVYCDKRRGR